MGLFSGIGSFLNDFTGISSQQNKTYKQQVQAMNAQNAYNAAMWNAQNEYNSPVAQLARMREAGIEINPTSYALGTGNLSNTATFVGSENGFSGSGSPAGNPISMALGVANGIAGIRNTNAQTENMYKQNENLSQVTESTSLENSIRRHNLKYAKDHNLPYGVSPSVGTATGDVVNSVKTWLKNNLGKSVNIGPDKSPFEGGLVNKIIRSAFKK